MATYRVRAMVFGTVLAATGLLSGCAANGSSSTVSTGSTNATKHSQSESTARPSSSPISSSTTPVASSTTQPASPSQPQSAAPTVTLGQWTGTKPSIVDFSGDSSNIVQGISWSSWGAASAIGVGSWGYNACEPTCAAGKVTNYSTTITLSDLVNGKYTKITETQSGPYGQTNSYSLPNAGLGASS